MHFPLRLWVRYWYLGTAGTGYHGTMGQIDTAQILAQYLTDAGYENHKAMKWRHRETRTRLYRHGIRVQALALFPEEHWYISSERFFVDLARAAWTLRKSSPA